MARRLGQHGHAPQPALLLAGVGLLVAGDGVGRAGVRARGGIVARQEQQRAAGVLEGPAVERDARPRVAERSVVGEAEGGGAELP
jgi:hypothetical protein